MPADESATAAVSQRRAWLRMVVELAVSLLVLVLLFRTFLASGYLIETGSMAPCLVGWHYRVNCPDCGHEFAVEGKRDSGKAVCPNCGKGGLVVDAGPRNDGDHLLVYRGAFDLRKPRRWEVVVFRNPQKPTQAYVKRLIGFPGETIELRDGDLFVNGAIQAKGYDAQLGMRILVYDHDCRPDASNPDWRPRWAIETPNGGWTADGGRFRHASNASQAANKRPQWVDYRHWIRRGGRHRTSVGLENSTESPPLAQFDSDPFEFDAARQQLVCRGAMPRTLRDELLAEPAASRFRPAIERLYKASHIAPITDTYGYNRGAEGGGDREVRDLMISLHAKLQDGPGEFLLELTDGVETLRCESDTRRREVRLRDVLTGKAVRTGRLPESLIDGDAEIDFSLMDRQALVAVDGKLPFEPWSYPDPPSRGSTPWRPARFGAWGVPVELSTVRLFRDVYYRPLPGAIERPARFAVEPDEYFVLGDNSPVSRDSRAWSQATVLKSDMFLGKPVVAHLPSRRERLRFLGREIEIRIPELSRIRYIR